MNGETPSVPITTLAGIASLTDCKWIFIHTFLKRFDQKKHLWNCSSSNFWWCLIYAITTYLNMYWSYAFILLQSKCPSFMRLTHYASSKSAEMATLQANSLLKLRFSPFVYTDLDAVCNSSSSIAAIKIALCKANIYRSACMPEWGQRIPTPEAYMPLSHISIHT